MGLQWTPSRAGGSTACSTVLAALFALATSTSSPALAGPPPPSALLERYRPVLHYDSRERYFAQPVVRPLHAPRRRPGSRVYGYFAREDGEAWLQYWLFYAYNPQDRGVFRTGRHEGDWEFLQLRVDESGKPELATLAQHSWAEGCRWEDLEHVRVGEHEAPVVYVANGSHANYPQADTYDRPFPDPNDETDGRGRQVRPQLEVIDDDHPGWISWAGRWGSSRAGIVPGEQSSPRGPRFQDGDPWRKPASFHRDRARPCGSGPPGRPWSVALVAALALLAVVAVLRARSRRHSAPG